MTPLKTNVNNIYYTLNGVKYFRAHGKIINGMMEILST
jgi:hypothetical protein